jgi:hypothetical protein
MYSITHLSPGATKVRSLSLEAAQQLGFLFGVRRARTSCGQGDLAKKVNGKSGLAEALRATRAAAAYMFTHRHGVLRVERTEEVEFVTFL